MKYEDRIFVEKALGYHDFFGYGKNYDEHDKNRFAKKNRINNILLRRKHRLNKKFPFTNENINRLQAVNDILDAIGKQSYEKAQKLERYALRQMQMQGSFVCDYEIEMELQLYAREGYMGVAALNSNPFYKSKYGLLFMKKGDWQHKDIIAEKKQLAANWNHFRFPDLYPGHPLRHQYHCWLFHDLYDHSYLAWQDILDTETIWTDVKLSLQDEARIYER